MTEKNKEQPAPPRTRKQKLEDREPWMPVEFDKADANALQALERGEADADQQKRALWWVINKACMNYDQTFYPGGDEGRRLSDFAQGRRFVGLSIVKLLKLALSRM